MRLNGGFLAGLILCAATGAAFADDWTAVKLRGDVYVLHKGAWVKLNRGDIVADDSVIRTLANGSAQFLRDRETIDLAPNTEIQIFDRVGKRYTRVREFFGDVGVEANVENVEHFSVETPFVAAVVKGTIFDVRSDAAGSLVTVMRGLVGVEDLIHRLHADVPAGQSAIAGKAARLKVVIPPSTAAAGAGDDGAAAAAAASNNPGQSGPPKASGASTQPAASPLNAPSPGPAVGSPSGAADPATAQSPASGAGNQTPNANPTTGGSNGDCDNPRHPRLWR